MSLAIFRAMLLGLLRDRGALLMSFVLPAVFFVIMAEAFTATTGESLTLQVSVHDEVADTGSSRLIEALSRAERISALRPEPSAADVRAQVATGAADIGLVLRADALPLDRLDGEGAAPLVIVTDPARGPARALFLGELRRAYRTAFPDVALAGAVATLEEQFLTLDEVQRTGLQRGLAAMREQPEQDRAPAWSLERLLAEEEVAGGEAVNEVAYAAGAVAFMFLLFASVQAAVSLLEEEETGILDRVLAGPGGVAVLINGKFLYIVLQGLVQVSVIFLVAWLGYGVDLPAHLGAWSVVTLAACLAAAGLAMLLATLCRTRRQAQTAANTVVLVLSALGGSMVPRWFMPETLRDLGWLTPNTWALEAYSGVFWRAEPLTELVLPLGLLITAGLVGWLAAVWLARRRAYG